MVFSVCPSVWLSVRPSHIFSCDQAALWMVRLSVRLYIISRHNKKSLIRSQIYHGYKELSTDTNYPIWRRQERSNYAVQLASWQLRSNSPKMSVRHTFLTMFPSSYHHEIFRSYYQWQKWRPCKRSRSEVKFQGHTAKKNRRFLPKMGVSGL